MNRSNPTKKQCFEWAWEQFCDTVCRGLRLICLVLQSLAAVLVVPVNGTLKVASAAKQPKDCTPRT